MILWLFLFFFFKQKTAYEMRISDWSSDVCSSDLTALVAWVRDHGLRSRRVASVCTGAFLLAASGWLDGRRVVTHWTRCEQLARQHPQQIGRASCRERVCQYV